MSRYFGSGAPAKSDGARLPYVVEGLFRYCWILLNSVDWLWCVFVKPGVTMRASSGWRWSPFLQAPRSFHGLSMALPLSSCDVRPSLAPMVFSR